VLVSDKGHDRTQSGAAISVGDFAMPDHPSKDFVAAYHEAGHAVGAFFLGVPFDDVSLGAATTGEGSVRSPLTIGEIRQSGLCWQYAIVSMLGREAERLVFGRADREYLQNDAETIVNLYITFFKADMACDIFRAQLRSRTAEVVGRPGFREAIDALARVVSVEQVVTESRAIDVIRSATASAYPH
jgi:hypothetical protein